MIGGYVYRGPIEELQGKYFYSDFVRTGRIWSLDFDRDTNPTNYDGDNGTNTDVTALWQSLVYDPTDPTYTPNTTTGSSAGLDHIVSFGEDNAGNLYLVDFGNGSGFNGQYPGPGLGEIFRVVPDLLAGDYNQNGLVEAADYALWRDTVGSASNLAADGNGDGTVDQEDYEVWKISFGNIRAMPSSAAAAVPEPADSMPLIVAVASFVVSGIRIRWSPLKRFEILPGVEIT